MPELTLEQAMALLQETDAYGWLINGPEAFSAEKVVEGLGESGISVHKVTVLRWFKSLPKYQDYGALGLYAARKDLIVYFAGRMRTGARYEDDDKQTTSGM